MIRPALIGGFAVALALITLPAGAITPEEHASHHPGGGAPGAPGTPGVAGGGMGEMMRRMMAPANPGATARQREPDDTPATSDDSPSDQNQQLQAKGAGPEAAVAQDRQGGRVSAQYQDCLQCHQPRPTGPPPPSHLEKVGNRDMGTVEGRGAAPAPAAAGPSAAGGMAGSSGGGMGEMMDGMMKKMGVPPPKDIYPTLMSFPDLTPEQREQVRVQATERLRSGVALLSEGLDRLAQSTENEDYAAMQEATAKLHDALSQFESGLAAKRALAEGQPPRGGTNLLEKEGSFRC